MNTSRTNRMTWCIVAAFATAMAWVESAVVFYIRTMIDRIEPYQPNPFPIVLGFASVELPRELATMIMLLTVGMLAGKTWRERLGYGAIAFGVWDIFYYVFLKVMCGWPHSLMDWDVLFLIPLPWWGPVLAPVLIALLMILWGTLVTQIEHQRSSWVSNLTVWGIAAVGMVLALRVFMADTLRVAEQGIDAIRNVLPERFNWMTFCLALVFMSAPIIQLIRPSQRQTPKRFAELEVVENL
ncbi:MAG TPA: hypothetical protein VK327_02095 [Candidatus Paceibacterota bacterium]|nr:hypothetical protein [Candidatus Paceibacterota bacterium]